MTSDIDSPNSSENKEKQSIISDSLDYEDELINISKPFDIETIITAVDDELDKINSVSTEPLSPLLQSTYESSSIISSNSTKLDYFVNGNEKIELCIICNDISNGKHYGVVACEGCKGFFKRTVRKNLKYKCREIEKCEVNEKSRNRCQFCRYKKCISKGMKVEAVQKERITTESKKYRKLKQSLQFKPKLNLRKYREINEDIIDEININNKDEVDNLNQKEMDINQIINSVLQSEQLFLSTIDKTIYVNNDPSCVGGPDLIINCDSLFRTINQELYNLVSWAKSLPGFENADQSKQIEMINKRWASVLVATVAYRTLSASIYHNEPPNQPLVHLYFSGNVCAALCHVELMGWLHLFNKWMEELVYMFRKQRVNCTEIALIKALILFHMPNVEPFWVARNKLIQTLSSYTKSLSHDQSEYNTQLATKSKRSRNSADLGNDSSNLVSQFRDHKLLMMMPIIENITLTFLEYCTYYLLEEPFVSQPNDRYPLLMELLRAHNSSSN